MQRVDWATEWTGLLALAHVLRAPIDRGAQSVVGFVANRFLLHLGFVQGLLSLVTTVLRHLGFVQGPLSLVATVLRDLRFVQGPLSLTATVKA
jgi:hypothetical protein